LILRAKKFCYPPTPQVQYVHIMTAHTHTHKHAKRHSTPGNYQNKRPIISAVIPLTRSQLQSTSKQRKTQA